MGQHARLSPSAAERWMNCPASVPLLEALGEEETSPYAEEGTAAHCLGELCLNTGRLPEEFLGLLFDEAPNYPVSQDMADHVSFYLDYVQEQKGDHGLILVEARLELFYSFGEHGTSDVVIIKPDGTLVVIDLKYGKGVKVSAPNNPQLRIYAGCAWGAYHELEITKVETHIVQPRLNHVSDEELSLEELSAFMDTVHTAKQVVDKPDAPFGPTEKGCMWCIKRLKHCDAQTEFCMGIMLVDFDDLDAGEMPATSESMGLDQIALVVEHTGLIKLWLNSIQAYVMSRLESGEGFPNKKLVAGKSNRKWLDEAAAMKMLRKWFLKREVVTEKIISAPQAINLAKKKLSKGQQAQLQAMVVKPQGSPTIADEDDPRKALPSIQEQVEDMDDLDELLNTSTGDDEFDGEPGGLHHPEECDLLDM
jgi:hypothetical protein